MLCRWILCHGLEVGGAESEEEAPELARPMLWNCAHEHPPVPVPCLTDTGSVVGLNICGPGIEGRTMKERKGSQE